MDFPASEVHIILAVVFITADVEADVDILADIELIKRRALVFDDFEFDVLRVFVMSRSDNEFPFGKSASERLSFTDPF